MYLGQYNNVPHRRLFWTFITVVIIAALAVANFTLTRATITIHPKQTKKVSEVNITIDIHAVKPDFSSSVLPGRILELEGEITEDITNISLRRTEDFSSGIVEIKNIWKKDFYLRKGAELVQGESPEALGNKPKNIFLLDEETTAPANGSVTATVTAKKPGVAGNIPPGKFYFLRMSRWNRERIWAESKEAFSGGEKEIRVVTEEDINRAVNKVAEDLGKRELEKMKSQISTDEKTYPSLTRVEIIESHASVEPETETEKFQMRVRGKVSAIVLNEKDLKEMAIEKFKGSVGASSEISKINKGQIKYELDDSQTNDGKAKVKVIISGILVPKLSSQIFEKQPIIGYNYNALRERFSKFPEIDFIEVKFFPAWKKSVPSFKSQINFEVGVK